MLSPPSPVLYSIYYFYLYGCRSSFRGPASCSSRKTIWAAYCRHARPTTLNYRITGRDTAQSHTTQFNQIRSRTGVLYPIHRVPAADSGSGSLSGQHSQRGPRSEPRVAKSARGRSVEFGGGANRMRGRARVGRYIQWAVLMLEWTNNNIRKSLLGGFVEWRRWKCALAIERWRVWRWKAELGRRA